jgi:hypothetical protein
MARDELKSLDGPRISVAAEVRNLDSLVQYSLFVPPDSAVAVFYAGTYTGSDGSADRAFSSLRLSVETTHGHRTYEGGEIPRAFRRLSRLAYVLELE